MALFPVYTNERDPNGLFRTASAAHGAEGGLVVRVADDGHGHAVVDLAEAGASDYSGVMYGLLDEQASRPGTMVGTYLGAAGPVAVGPATDLASGRSTIWQGKGYFLTDKYDGAAPAAAGTALNALNSGAARGTLTAGAGASTRVTYMGKVSSPADLLGSYVSPAPATGLFAEGPMWLVYQA